MSGLGRSGTGTLRVDGKEVATHKLERTLPMILQWDESFGIGPDTLTGVNNAGCLHIRMRPVILQGGINT
jgi:hypothetical protein